MDGGVFLLDNGAGRIYYGTEDGLALAMKSSHYLLFASICLDHWAIPTIHEYLDNEAGPNLVLSDVLPIHWRHNIVPLAQITWLNDTNGRPLQLLDMLAT